MHLMTLSAIFFPVAGKGKKKKKKKKDLCSINGGNRALLLGSFIGAERFLQMRLDIFVEHAYIFISVHAPNFVAYLFFATGMIVGGREEGKKKKKLFFFNKVATPLLTACCVLFNYCYLWRSFLSLAENILLI